MKISLPFAPLVLVSLICLFSNCPVRANLPGGGTGTGADVTLVDKGSTVTIANGIVSILCTKAGATINQINYTYNNGKGTTTTQLLAGGTDGGQLYWETGGFSTGTFTYTLVTDPAGNGGNYAEISLLSTSATNGTLEIHFSMLRGSTGFYVTPIWAHRSVDGAIGLGETRDNIYAGSIFNWMSVDAARSRLMSVSPSAGAIAVLNAPPEVTLWTNGIYEGQYEDKYKYSADLGVQRVWGWSSVGTGGLNVGLWNISASGEYYNGGPMKRELMEHIGTTVLNMLNGGHYGGGHDGSWNAGEVWTKVYGPYFIYCNNITNTITGTNVPAQALYADALAQGAAEQSAWPYNWFTNANYAPAADRGTVTGQILIHDSGNPNASAAGLWVGVVQQPSTTDAIYDFQEWMKPYQFWVKSDMNGNFTIPNVIAGANYTLYAFGPGAAGTFQSQNQIGGNAPNTVDVPAAAFSVTVTAGATNSLGTVTWTPTRVGPTVFEIGYPDRTGGKFRHGDDYWVGDFGPSPAAPSPVWSKHLEYPFDFPNGPDYVVGQSRWTTDWNYVQPVVTDSQGNFDPSSSTITFNLASAPASGAQGSFYIALSSDYQGPLEISVNGTAIAGSTGYFPAYSSSADESDTTIRQGIHGCFSDNRITFAANLLTTGQNTITITIRKNGYFANHAMYDYLRLELTGYVPPPPSVMTVYPGNNCNLICWPVTPGATSYNLLRSTTPSGNYAPLTNGVVGPVCGSGTNNAVYTDATAVNGLTYYYVIQSVNPGGTSTNSLPSAAASPTASIASTASIAPDGLAVTSSGHQNVTLGWNASPGANFYSVWRSTLVNTGGGSTNTLGTIILNNAVTGTSYTDTSPTDGSTYGYFVTATSAGGTSGNSLPVVAVPLPAPPAAAPGTLTASFEDSTNITLDWSPVAGAVGYIITRSTSPTGPFAYLMSVTETTYLDTGLNPANTYYYQVSAVNGAGFSANAVVSATAAPIAPASLSAIAGNAQVVLNWTAVPGAVSYLIYGGTSSNSLTTLVSAYSGTSYTNTGLINGTTYYYEVAAANSGGLGPNSPEASATPAVTIIVAPRSLLWKGDGVANIWDVSGTPNWQTNNVATVFNNGDTATFDSSGSNNVPVTLETMLQPALVVVNAAKNYTFGGAGSFTGTNALIKSGTGTLTINTTNYYSGGTVISNGTVAPGNIEANQTCWGSGTITLLGGTIQFNGYAGSTATGWGGCTNLFIVPAGQTGTLQLPPRWGYSAPFTSALMGGGTLNVTVDYVRDFFSGDWSAFTGQINVSVRSGTGDFRINNAAGYARAAIYLNNGVNLYNINANSQLTDIGELGGTVGAFIGAGSSSSSNPTWRIGARNTTNTYAGTIADAGATSLIKIGSGTLVLTGTNTYSGGTTVNGGTLLVNNASGSGTGSGAVTVANGGTLGGNGTITGATTISQGGTLAPGNPLGILTISNNLTLAAGSITYVRVQHAPFTNDVVLISGTLNEGGTLIATNFGTSALVANDQFKLFNAGNYSGSFNGFVLPPLTNGLVWNTDLLATSGTLEVNAYSPPVFSTPILNGANLNFTGTGGIPDWTYYVLTTTNLTAPWKAVATNQFDANGNFTFTNALNPNSSPIFYRLQLQ